MKIICILGNSGSGKTYALEHLNPEHFNIVESWTTRPPRTPNEKGHKFTTKEKLGIATFDVETQKEAIYCTTLASTYVNGEFYFINGFDLSEYKTNVYVIDEQGIEELKHKMPFADIEVWFLDVDMDTCIRQMTQRGDNPTKIKERLLWDAHRHNMQQYADYIIYDSKALARALSSKIFKSWYICTGMLVKSLPSLPKQSNI